MAQTRIALIGLGMAVTPHAKSLLDLQDRVAVAHAFSPSAKRREDFAARYPFPTCESLDTILADPSVTAAIVLTPPNTHLDIVGQLAAAGKHVLLEKPLEISVARAEALIANCRTAGVALGVVLQHRYRPAAMRLRQLLNDGKLGALLGASTGIRLWRPQDYYDQPGRGDRDRDGGGVLLTQGIHTLDLLLQLAGPVERISGFATTTPVHRMETEDLAVAALHFANGALGVLEATTAAYPGYPERIEINGELGTATLQGTALTVRYQDGSEENLTADATPGGTGADPMAFPHDYHRALIEDFLQAVESGQAPPVSGESALAVQRLIEALLESATTGTPVALGSL